MSFKSAFEGKELALPSDLKQRFGADIGESTYYNRIPYGTIRQPTTRGLFGSKIDDRELLFAVQREPSAFRIVFGVAKDTLDNWFTIELVDKDDKGKTNLADSSGTYSAPSQMEIHKVANAASTLRLLTLITRLQ